MGQYSFKWFLNLSAWSCLIFFWFSIDLDWFGLISMVLYRDSSLSDARKRDEVVLKRSRRNDDAIADDEGPALK